MAHKLLILTRYSKKQVTLLFSLIFSISVTHSTVTDFAKFLGLSTSVPFINAT